ncbi:MAG TPA: hypothetical protein VHF22_12910, partial [Planctomycetota bacterium]|nr:hypothetical protein [Planctomycetota bacterium]
MAASYTDILLGRLALQNGVVGGDQLRECLNAQEAGKRAGVEQTLSQVLVKRGYLTRAQQRDLEAARDVAVRARRAKVAVQLLLRHGRPAEAILQGFYQELKAQDFPLEFSVVLEQQGHLSPQERAGLEQAIERAISSLHQREAEELARLVEQHAGLRPRPPVAPQPPAPPAYALPEGAAAPYAPPPP